MFGNFDFPFFFTLAEIITIQNPIILLFGFDLCFFRILIANSQPLFVVHRFPVSYLPNLTLLGDSFDFTIWLGFEQVHRKLDTRIDSHYLDQLRGSRIRCQNRPK
ncbi:hypothetical protein LOK49_Contig96G00003 [Camellia lanceoleosa]|nr:hypothetical protein LOK49_Contig96G00003 [Camellia lanceoleosa]